MLYRSALLFILLASFTGADASEEDPVFDLPVPADPIRGLGFREDTGALNLCWFRVCIKHRGYCTDIERAVFLPLDCPVDIRIPIDRQDEKTDDHVDIRLRLIDGEPLRVEYEIAWTSVVPANISFPRLFKNKWSRSELTSTLRSFAEGVAGMPRSRTVRLAVLPAVYHDRAAVLSVKMGFVTEGDDDQVPVELTDDSDADLKFLRLPRGCGLPPPLGTEALEEWMKNADASVLKKFTLRLAPGATGRVGWLLERPYRWDADVEVGQACYFVDVVPGLIPFGLTARIDNCRKEPVVSARFTWLANNGEFRTTLGNQAPPITIDLPEPASVTAAGAIQEGASIFGLADLAEGSMLAVRLRCP